MLPIVEQRVTKDEIFVKFSNGNSFQVTRSELRDIILNTNGSVAKKRATVRKYVLGGYSKALGEDIPDELLTFEADDGGFIGFVGVGLGTKPRPETLN